MGQGYSQRHIHAAGCLEETEAKTGKGKVAFSSTQTLRKNQEHTTHCGEEEVSRGGGGRDGAQQTGSPQITDGL